MDRNAVSTDIFCSNDEWPEVRILRKMVEMNTSISAATDALKFFIKAKNTCTNTTHTRKCRSEWYG
jgi:hypothetical protein